MTEIQRTMKNGFYLFDRRHKEFGVLRMAWSEHGTKIFELKWTAKNRRVSVHKNPIRLRYNAINFVLSKNTSQREIELRQHEKGKEKLVELIVTPPELGCPPEPQVFNELDVLD